MQERQSSGYAVPLWIWLPTLLQTVLAAVLCFVPLFDLLAYEFCLATAALAAVTSVVVGLGAARGVTQGRVCIARALAATLLHLLPGLLLISANAMRVRNCDYTDGLLFYFLLPVLSAVYGALLGAFVGRMGATWGVARRGLLMGLVVLVPLVWSLWNLFWQPPIFIFDHLWGYFAGSLYDESINVEPRLWYLRLGTCLRIFVLASVILAWDLRRAWGWARYAAWSAVGLVVVLGYDAVVGPWSGYRVDRREIQRALSQEVRRPNLVIHLPEGTPGALANAIGDDHLFRLDALVQALGVTLTQPIHSYVYANPDQKAHLMGGRNTMIAKPWLHEIHVHNPSVPHPIMPHELAHAVAAEFGSKLLKVSAQHELFVNMGWIEGFATAFTPDQDELDLHHWARAMQVLKLAPDVRAIVGPAGFWGQAPRRAYTVAGSFVRYLLTTHGAEALKAAYPSGDFQGAYHQDLNALVQGWEAFLGAITISERERHIAAERFRAPSIFMRPCAHEIAQLTDAARRADAATAVLLQKQICTHLDNAPTAQLDLAQAMLRAQDTPGFLNLAQALLQGQELNAVQRADLRLTRAMVQFEADHMQEARADAEAVLASHTGVGVERLAWAYDWGLGLEPEERRPAMKFLANQMHQVTAALWLERASTEFEEDKTYPYLMGRQLVRIDSWEEALHYLQRAQKHPFAAIEAERLRLVADCLWHLGRLDGASAAYQAYAKAALTSGESEQARDWLRRIAWQQTHNDAPVQP